VADVAEVAIVGLLVVALGLALRRFVPNPPNPLARRENRLAWNIWANTWWTGAGVIVLAPVLAYLQGVLAGGLALGAGVVLIAGAGGMLRLWK
jgi:fatty acid desaturase